MGLSTWIDRLAADRPHVLVVEVPGHCLVRMRLEGEITSRGWVLAESPADADVLLVCGEPYPPFPDVIEGLWNQMPGPRCCVSVTGTDAIIAALDEIPALLSDRKAQLADAAQRPRAGGDETADHDTDASGEAEAHGDHEDDRDGSHHGSAGDDVENSDHAEPAPHEHHEGHEGMQDSMQDDPGHGDHADGGMEMDHMDMHMDMSGPAGIPLAGGDDTDRDGLEMDITHLPLGPVLPHWPAGLIVRCTLHGDVIAEAALEVIPSAATDTTDPAAPSEPLRRAAELCDAAGHLLAVAGWEPVAARVRRLRDELLRGTRPAKTIRAGLHRTSTQVARSRTLRWSLHGIPALGGVDARSRLLGWLSTAGALLEDGGDGAGAPDSSITLDEVQGALIGQELAAARLVIACLEPVRIGDLVGAERG